MGYLPSKKFATVLAILLLGGGVFWFVFGEEKNMELAKKKVVYEVQKKEENSTPGIDWKRTLETNSESRLNQEIIAEGASSPTENLFRLVIGTYAGGGELDAQTQEKFVDSTLSNIKTLVDKKDPYTTTQFSVDENLSVKSYLNRVAEITQKYFPGKPSDPGYENEIIVLQNLKTGEDFLDLGSRLKKYILRYRSAESELKNIRPPKEALSLHAGFLNSFTNTAFALEEISNYPKDPVIGLAGMFDYGSEVEKSRKLFADVKSLIQKNEIVFESNEPGYELTLYFPKS